MSDPGCWPGRVADSTTGLSHSATAAADVSGVC